MLRGDELWCQFFSEPAAGSDLAGVQTRATRADEDGWRLDGAKIWSSLAHLADWGMCLARTNWDVPKHKGLTWFGVPTDAPGLTVRPIRQIGESNEFCEEFLDGVAVPDTERIGDVDHRPIMKGIGCSVPPLPARTPLEVSQLTAWSQRATSAKALPCVYGSCSPRPTSPVPARSPARSRYMSER